MGDVTAAPALIEGLAGGSVRADKAYDSNAFCNQIASIGVTAMIPSNPTRKILIPHGATAYKRRNRIERCFNWLKYFRRFATRYDPRIAQFTGSSIMPPL